MKKQIRRNVFETNSSSVHSLVFSKDGLEPNEFNINCNGEIVVGLEDFEGCHIYKDQYSKLSYLLTCLYYLSDCDVERIYDNYSFELIVKAVCSYTGAKTIKIIGSEGYIDHQSVPCCDIEIINVYNEDEVINYIFNRNIWLKTDYD